MLRSRKAEVVETLNREFGAHPHLFVAKYSGLSGTQVTELRSKVREIGGSYRVIKNRLAKRAASGTGAEGLAEVFSGPCAVAAHESDPVGLAKVLTGFAKDHPSLEVFAGVIDGAQVLDQGGVKQLSSLPGLPELRAQLLALINTPATTLARLVSTPGTQIARVVDARREGMDEG